MDLGHLAEEVVERCQVWQQVNACHTKVGKGKRPRGSRPRVFWEIDFTEIKSGKYGYKYLLVFVDTFSGWVESFPPKQETTMVVAKKILEDFPGLEHLR